MCECLDHHKGMHVRVDLKSIPFSSNINEVVEVGNSSKLYSSGLQVSWVCLKSAHPHTAEISVQVYPHRWEIWDWYYEFLMAISLNFSLIFFSQISQFFIKRYIMHNGYFAIFQLHLPSAHINNSRDINTEVHVTEIHVPVPTHIDKAEECGHETCHEGNRWPQDCMHGDMSATNTRKGRDLRHDAIRFVSSASQFCEENISQNPRMFFFICKTPYLLEICHRFTEKHT